MATEEQRPGGVGRKRRGSQTLGRKRRGGEEDVGREAAKQADLGTEHHSLDSVLSNNECKVTYKMFRP